MSAHSQTVIPVLGSALLEIAEAERGLLRDPLSCGLASIDNLVLDGGFRYGEIISIAGATATGKTLFAFHAIANHLIDNPTSKVALIDTAGTLSLNRLRDVLILRLQKKSIYLEKRHQIDLPSVDHMLNRVNYTRVFDLAGVVEAVDEVSRSWEVHSQQINEGVEPKLRVIVDSEDEDELDKNDEDDTVESLSNRNDPNAKGMTDQPAGLQGRKPIQNTVLIDMIVIDTISNVVTSVMSKSQVQGQALLTSFMRSLHLLTSRRRICTLLINAVVGINRMKNPGSTRESDDNASIFAATSGKPALGKAYAYLIDTSIFLSSIPKTKADAEIAYGEDDDTTVWESVGVMEIIKDRNGASEGHWATFEVHGGIDLRDAF